MPMPTVRGASRVPARGERRTNADGSISEWRVWGTSQGTKQGWMPVRPAPAAAAPPPPAPAPPPPPPPAPYKPTPLAIDQSLLQGATSTASVTPVAPAAGAPPPETPPQMFAPGGMSAGVTGNAGGFRRKKSSGRASGQTSKGTNQFKIAKQAPSSPGLNIGV